MTPLETLHTRDTAAYLVEQAFDILLSEERDPETFTESMLYVLANTQLALAYAQLCDLGFNTSTELDAAELRLSRALNER